MKKKILSIFLAVALVFTSAIFVYGVDTSSSEPVIEIKEQPEDETIYKYLDLGIIHVWGDKGSKQYHATKDALYDKSVKWEKFNGQVQNYGSKVHISFTKTFPEPIKVLNVEPLDLNNLSNFNFDQKTNLYNETAMLHGGEENSESRATSSTFKENEYDKRSAISITNCKWGEEETKTPTISYDVLLKFNGEDEETIDHCSLSNIYKEKDTKTKKEKITTNLLQYITTSENYEEAMQQIKAADINTYKRISEGVNGKINQSLVGYTLLMPVVISYQKGVMPPPYEPPKVVTPPETMGKCQKVIRWNEVKSHTYTVCSGSGKKRRCSTRTCNHVYTYETTLTTTAKLVAAKKNGNLTTFKSGYGFDVIVDCKISTRQVSNSGSCGKSLTKPNSKIPVPPTYADVTTSWTVKNAKLGTVQPKVIVLDNMAKTATTSNFRPAKNKISHDKNRLIYTDVKIPGTKKKPVKHTITVFVNGGGVNGVLFCEKVPLTFTINGNMYEDDATTDRTHWSELKK